MADRTGTTEAHDDRRLASDESQFRSLAPSQWLALAASLIFVIVGYGAALIYGLAAVGEEWDFLSLNVEDNWLHLALTVLGLVIAGLAYRDIGVASARRSHRPAGRDAVRGRRPAPGLG